MNSLWPIIITAAVTAFVSVLTYRSATKANRIARVSIDAEAYARAQKIYDGTIEQLRKDNARLTEQIERLEARIRVLEDQAK